jgi:hypothetical protein
MDDMPLVLVVQEMEKKQRIYLVEPHGLVEKMSVAIQSMPHGNYLMRNTLSATVDTDVDVSTIASTADVDQSLDNSYKDCQLLLWLSEFNDTRIRRRATDDNDNHLGSWSSNCTAVIGQLWSRKTTSANVIIDIKDFKCLIHLEVRPMNYS